MADWFDTGALGGLVDVLALLDGQGVVEGIGHLVEAGALVSIGCTSDGGALGLTVTLDERRKREYFRSVDDLRDWLAEAVPAVRQMAEGRTASDARRSRQRRR